MDVTIILIYFGLTSLSTIGFGDYHPISNAERLISTFMLLFGVSIFSWALAELHQILVYATKTEVENEKNSLDKFFGII